MERILVTGAAGFIGFHFATRMLRDGHEVIGLDNLNDYYDVRLKEGRLNLLEGRPGFRFVKLDLADRDGMRRLFAETVPAVVVNLGAQAGVRYSLENPAAYVDANVAGFQNVLDGCREHRVKQLLYASSSSVYGANRKTPFLETDTADHPVSLYAATKRANELQAHAYSHLFGIPTTGLRFFTVYGPWGRPDMALFLFTSAILAGRPIDVFNQGRMKRDFTYVDDVVESMARLVGRPAQVDPNWDAKSPRPSSGAAPFEIFNIGASRPVELGDLIAAVEKAVGKPAKRNLLPMQPGDVLETYADSSALERATGYRPSTALSDGVENFVRWYRDYYKT